MGFSDSLSGFSNAASNFNPDNIFQVFDGAGFSKVAFFLKMFFWMAVVIGGCIAYYKLFLQYKIKITLKKRIGGNAIETKFDRAKIVTDSQNKKKLQLYKNRNGKLPISCPIPASRFKGKTGRLDHYTLFLDDNFQLHPVEEPQDKDLEERERLILKVKPQERDAWARFEDKRLAEKYKKKDMLEKYLPSAILMMAMITAFLIWFFAAKQLGAGLADLAQQFGQVASSCTRLGV